MAIFLDWIPENGDDQGLFDWWVAMNITALLEFSVPLPRKWDEWI